MGTVVKYIQHSRMNYKMPTNLQTNTDEAKTKYHLSDQYFKTLIRHALVLLAV
jgi:hypothetical protein